MLVDYTPDPRTKMKVKPFLDFRSSEIWIKNALAKVRAGKDGELQDVVTFRWYVSSVRILHRPHVDVVPVHRIRVYSVRCTLLLLVYL